MSVIAITTKTINLTPTSPTIKIEARLFNSFVAFAVYQDNLYIGQYTKDKTGNLSTEFFDDVLLGCYKNNAKTSFIATTQGSAEHAEDCDKHNLIIKSIITNAGYEAASKELLEFRSVI